MKSIVLQNGATQNSHLGDDMRACADQEIVGMSPKFREVMRKVAIVASADCAVLIQGETGTGKEVIAKAIHDQSSRRSGPFVRVNCAAIPAGLLESELFGHEKGAFTGAWTQRAGRFQLANGGTLLLDEIGDLPLELQPKLLRVLQEQEFERLGSAQTIRTDVRIIAATNQDLEQMVVDRKFRADLFYRLNVFPIAIPSLRERPEDVEPLLMHFVGKYAERMNKEIDEVSQEVLEILRGYDWPGNIRELQNFAERAVLMTAGPVLHTPVAELKTFATRKLPSSGPTLANVERSCMMQALRSSGWKIGGHRGAAAKVGLARTTFIARMRRYGIVREASGSRELCADSWSAKAPSAPQMPMPAYAS
jgi:transcriptional regulator with GAF, ATPase, and Fis domain